MKSFIPIIIILFILLNSCQESNEKKISLVKDFKTSVKSVENNHKVYHNILAVLNEIISNVDDLDMIKDNGKEILKLDSIEIGVEDNKIYNIKNGKVNYLFNSVNNIEITYSNKDTIVRGYLIDNICDGIFKEAYNNYETETKYSKGDTLSITERYNNGKLRKKINYINNKPHGNYTEFHENGTKHKQFNYNKGLIDGIYEEWYKNGKLKTKLDYIKGSKEGEQIIYHEASNTMKLKRFFNKNEKEGIEIMWYPSAYAHYKVFYKNGKLNGEVIVYQENSNLKKMSGFYKDNLKSGIFNVWNENGQSVFSAKYELDQLINQTKGNAEDVELLLEAEDIIFEENY